MSRPKSAAALLSTSFAMGLILALAAPAAEARSHHKTQRAIQRHAVERGNKHNARTRSVSPARGAQTSKTSNRSAGARAGRTNSK